MASESVLRARPSGILLASSNLSAMLSGLQYELLTVLGLCQGKRTAIKFGTYDSNFSLCFAFFVNAAILIVAGAAFYLRPLRRQERRLHQRRLPPYRARGVCFMRYDSWLMQVVHHELPWSANAVLRHCRQTSQVLAGLYYYLMSMVHSRLQTW